MSENDIVRAIAASEVRFHAENRKTVIEEHSSSFKWLMASFLTLNAGGLLALDQHFTATGSSAIAAAAFYVGIVSALGIGWFGQRVNRACLEPIRELEVFWIGVEETGEFNEDRFNDLHGKLKAASKSRAAPSGWLSLLAFTVGLAAIASSHIHFHWADADGAMADNVEMPADQAVPVR